MSTATEDYDSAYLRYQTVSDRIGDSKARLSRIKKRVGTLQEHLGTRSEDMYRNGPTQFLELLLGAVDFEQLVSTWDLLKDMSQSDAEKVIELKEAKREALVVQARLEKQQADARKQLNVMADRKARIAADQATRKRMLSGLESEIARLEAAEEAAQRLAARSLIQRRIPVAVREDFPAPTRAPRSQVVEIAKRYLGAPYQWAAAGPDRFDCSGFTMFVYNQVGVSLPHSSRAQYNSGQHVPRSALEPGDLVFFGSPIHHVGIYVGGGMYIHAPRTGDVVKISSMGRYDYAGATRP